jgi:hypothetical protein
MSLSFQVGKSCFTDKMDRIGGKACEFGQVSHKRVERPAKLIFRRTANGDARQLGLDACAVSETTVATVLLANSYPPPFRSCRNGHTLQHGKTAIQHGKIAIETEFSRDRFHKPIYPEHSRPDGRIPCLREKVPCPWRKSSLPAA